MMGTAPAADTCEAVIAVAAATPAVITNTPPATATVGVDYSFTPAVTGGITGAPGIRTYTLSGTRPAGIMSSAEDQALFLRTGQIRGKPSTGSAGSYPGLVITVVDPTGSYAQPAFTITVS